MFTICALIIIDTECQTLKLKQKLLMDLCLCLLKDKTIIGLFGNPSLLCIIPDELECVQDSPVGDKFVSVRGVI